MLVSQDSAKNSQLAGSLVVGTVGKTSQVNQAVHDVESHPAHPQPHPQSRPLSQPRPHQQPPPPDHPQSGINTKLKSKPNLGSASQQATMALKQGNGNIKISLKKNGDTWTPTDNLTTAQSVRDVGIVGAAESVVSTFLSGIRATFRTASVTDEVSNDI